MDGEIFDALDNVVLGSHLFPNLQQLEWCPLSPPPIRLFRYARLFLTPCITTLTLRRIDTISDLSIFCNLALVCPVLKNICVEVGDVDERDVTRSVSAFVRDLKSLVVESVMVPSMDEQALVHLAISPKLVSLQLGLVPSFLSTFWQTATSLFPALTQLVTRSFADTTKFLILWDKQPLTSIQIVDKSFNCVPRMTPRSTAEFLCVLADRCDHETLDHICINETVVHPVPSPNAVAVGEGALKRLFDFCNLTSVLLTNAVGFDVDDAMILAMADAWPRLEALHMFADPLTTARSRVTLEGLHAFAQASRMLKDLKLTFDATVVPDWETADGRERESISELERLHVGISPVVHEARAAKFLSIVFPKLSELLNSVDEGDWPVNDPEAYDADVVVRWQLVKHAIFHKCFSENVSLLKGVYCLLTPLFKGDSAPFFLTR